jgi:hypothetical protein
VSSEQRAVISEQQWETITEQKEKMWWMFIPRREEADMLCSI